MSLIIFSNSEYSFLWPLIEETISKIVFSNKVFVSDKNDLIKPIGFNQYITYNNDNCYSKRWTLDILPQITTEYIIIVHDVQLIINFDNTFIYNLIEILQKHHIDRCSLNVFNGNEIIEENTIKICNLNNATGNTLTPYDLCPAIWNANSFNKLFEVFSEETYSKSELNPDLQTYCKENYKCYGLQKFDNRILYCLGRPYLEYFKILHITIKKEITYPIEVYMDMKDDFLYYLNKYNLDKYVTTNTNYSFILSTFRRI
jgi:hypothetical protein